MSIIALGREADRRSIRSPLTWRLMGNDDGREGLRKQVADFLFFNARPRHDHVVFGLPGPSWQFEKMMNAQWGRGTRFIGLERSWPIVEAGLTSMPGDGRRRMSIDLFDSTIHGFRSDRAVVWCAEAEVFFVGPTRRGSRVAIGDWRAATGKWTAAWLDFSGPLGRDSLIVLPRVQCKTNMFVPEVPIALTFMRGRETPETTNAIELAGGRVEYATALLQSANHGEFVYSHHIDTGGNGEAAMTTMFGIIGNGRYVPRPKGATP